jgi:hypothetical protein
MTARELLASALTLPEADRVKLAAELLASVAPGEELSVPAWEAAWLAEPGHFHTNPVGQLI